MLSKATRLHTLLKHNIRHLTAIDPNAFNLKVELPGFLVFLLFIIRSTPKLKPAKDLIPPETLTTVLPSGLTVASRETYQTVYLIIYSS